MNKKAKSDNRKAFPQFLLVILLSGFIGGFIGLSVGILGHGNLPEQIIDTVYKIFTLITPFAIYVITIGLLIPEIILFKKAKKLFNSWDGEDENIMEKAEEKLSFILLLTSINLILDFFFFCLYHLVDTHLYSALTLIGFLLSIFTIIFIQQKTVDLTKKMNPEKKGSIYDSKFQKKWFESCDENEQRQIGKAAYKAFTSANYACMMIFAILMILGIIFPVTILPAFITALISGVLQVTFILESIKIGKHK